MTLLVLAPDCYGGLRMYLRRDRGPLLRGPTVAHPREVRDCLLGLPSPRSVVLCGRRFADELSDAFLDLADLFVVPNTWLRHIPRLEPGERAAHAARFAVAHARTPIEHRIGLTDPCPF